MVVRWGEPRNLEKRGKGSGHVTCHTRRYLRVDDAFSLFAARSTSLGLAFQQEKIVYILLTLYYQQPREMTASAVCTLDQNSLS